MLANSALNEIMFEKVKYISVSCQQALNMAMLNSAGEVPYLRDAVIHKGCNTMMHGNAKYLKNLLHPASNVIASQNTKFAPRAIMLVMPTK